MIWRFTILDRNNVATVIEEPVGWDASVSEINRDLNWHGIFFSNQGDSFEFDGIARELIKAEYEEYGVQGIMTLVMEEDCGAGYEEFSRGRFMFKDYDDQCGNDCFVKIPLETDTEVKNLRARINQKVNLETTLAFDGVTALPVYDKLAFPLTLPSKGLLLRNLFEQEKDFTTPVLGPPLNNNPNTNSNSFNSEYGMIEFGLDKQTAAEIGNSGTPAEPLYNCVLTSAGNLGCNSLNRFQFTFPLTNSVAPLDISPVVNYQEDTPNYGQVSDVIALNISLQGSVQNLNCQQLTMYFVVCTLPKGKTGLSDSHYIYHERSLVVSSSFGATSTYNLSYLNNSFVLSEGDRVFIYLATYQYRKNLYAGTNSFNFSISSGSFIKMETLSHTAPSLARVFAINESISRVAETITNNKLKAYSEYFGRTDSQPYALPADGCGSMEAITNGIRIRGQENRIVGSPSLYSVSLQDLFNGLNPIHNIGMGLEPDAERPGYSRLRIEPWKYFYNDTIVLTCEGINKINRKCYEKDIYSTFQFGYAKWEAEEYSGLDEFLTKRSFRTTLSEIKNDFVQLSSFIASGYALEITKRKGENNSKDWRYDKESFIICLKRSFTYTNKGNFYASGFALRELLLPEWAVIGATITIASSLNNGNYTITSVAFATGVGYDIGLAEPVTITASETITITSATNSHLEVEAGNITSPENIIDPPTLYNYRISPIRNAMRWMNKILATYRKYNSDAKLMFTDGDANYYAKGLMTDSNCRIEAAAIAENVQIDLSIFADPAFAEPFIIAERVTFDYPISSQEFNLVRQNPNGLIYFSAGCDEGYGWIDNIKYRPEEGLASFSLIPKKV